MSGPVDVLAWLDGVVAGSESMDRASGIGPSSQTTRARIVRSAVAELIEEGKKLLPRNLCLNNPRWPDSTEIPLTTTLGELRSFAATLANVGSAS